jgi:hypothetical protein
MSKPERVDLRKIVTIGGSQGIVLAPERLLKMNWAKGCYVWIHYHSDKIEITKNSDQIPKRGKN